MFNKEDMIEDPSTDEAGQLMNAMHKIQTWTKVKRGLFNELEGVLTKKKYISFAGHTVNYHISCVGPSCLYQIPLNRRGHLSVFRGKLIRLVCVRSGQYERSYMAGLYP